VKRSEQYELFYRFFDAENERYESLNKRASIYLTVVSGLTLFAGLKLDELFKFISTQPITLVLAGMSGVLVLGCILATVLSLRVYPYKDVCDLDTFIVEIEERGYDDEDIYSVLLANLADATRSNREINDKRAHYLEWSVALLGLAVVIFILNNVVAVALFH
jgi:hypothetical protein